MSARYLCSACWRTLSPAEIATAPPAEAPAALAAAAPAPPAVEEAPPVPAPAPQPQPRIGLHWTLDPNPPVAGAAVPVAAASVAMAVSPAPSPTESAPRRKWSGWIDSLLGEDEGSAHPAGDGKAVEGPVFCRCGAPLGAGSLLEGKPSLLGFAGAPRAGKQLLLLSMLHQLELAEPDPNGPRIALQGLGEADEVFRPRRRALFRNFEKPASGEDPTADAARGYGWRLRYSRPDARASGRRQDQPLPGGRVQLVGCAGGEGERLERHDALLNLLVLVLDGAALLADIEIDGGDAWSGPPPPGDLGAGDLQRFAALRRRLGRRTRDISLAIVISKSDLLLGSEKWAALGPGGAPSAAEREAAIARLLKESWRGPLLDEARDLFRRVGLFACSSLGFRPRLEDLAGEGHPTLNRPPRPHQVLAPLDFLLEDVLPRRRA